MRADKDLDNGSDRLNLWRLAKVGSLRDLSVKRRPTPMRSVKLLKNHVISLSQDKDMLNRPPSSGANSTGTHSKQLRNVVVDPKVEGYLQISEHSSESIISSIKESLSSVKLDSKQSDEQVVDDACKSDVNLYVNLNVLLAADIKEDKFKKSKGRLRSSSDVYQTKDLLVNSDNII